MRCLLPSEKRQRDICLALRAVEEPIYLVGGYVRDWLLGKTSHDLDFAVVGRAIPLARRLADTFRGYFVLLDRERDTARIVLGQRGKTDYVDLAGIRGGDIRDDLAARDFTINAIAVDVKHLEADPIPLLDPLHGQEDIANRTIRATSGRTFRDDPLRLLRAVRQAATLGFRISPDTESLIRRDASLIIRVAGERVRDELAQLCACPAIAENLRYLDRLGILAHIFPELTPLRGIMATLERSAYELALDAVEAVDILLTSLSATAARYGRRPLAALSQVLSPYAPHLAAHFAAVLSDTRDRAILLKFAALLHLTGMARAAGDESPGDTSVIGAEIAARALQRLRFSGREVNLAESIIRHQRWPVLLADQTALTLRDRYRFFRRLGPTGVDVLCLSLASGWASGEPQRNAARWERQVAVVGQLLSYYVSEWPQIKALPSLLDGEVLMRELHLRAGPLIGQLLAGIREAQAVGEIGSRDEALSWARSWMRRQRAQTP